MASWLNKMLAINTSPNVQYGGNAGAINNIKKTPQEPIVKQPNYETMGGELTPKLPPSGTAQTNGLGIYKYSLNAWA